LSAATTARNVPIAIWTILAVLVSAGMIWYVVFTANKPAPATLQPAADAQLVREDSYRVTNPVEEKAQLVEFLDFECESCRAAEPLQPPDRHPHSPQSSLAMSGNNTYLMTASLTTALLPLI
jgi:hypothetical protein